MLLKIKTLFSKKNIKKLLRSSLCLILCLMTVICFGGVLAPVQANAVAGVDDAIFFIVAFLICCGMTFASTSAATNAAQHFYAQAPPSVQEIIDYQAEQLQKDTALPLGIVEFLKSDWKALIVEFMAQFPQYCNIDLDYSTVVKNQLTQDSLFKTLAAGAAVTISHPWKRDTNIFIQSSVSTTISFYGIDTLKSVFGSALYNKISQYNSSFGNQNNTQFVVYSVPALDFSIIGIIGFNNLSSDCDISLTYRKGLGSYDIFIGGFGVSSYLGSYSLAIYKNEICDASYDSLNYITLTSQTYGNVISNWIADDVISRNDNLINCDDLTIYIDNLSKLLLGEDVFGTGVDAAHLPGIDSFPSTADDLTDVSTYPDSIGISVPRDLSDTITKTAEDIRTVDKDKTDTKDDTKEDPDTKPNKPSIPCLSLPEILFKEKFPFCLPWDLYNLFAGLQTEEEAPRFVVPFKFERLGIDEEIVIDFSDYEEQIKIIRFFIGAAFVLALVMISRKLIGAE